MPDHESTAENGIERRDLLKGVGLGAASTVVGTGLFAGSAVGQPTASRMIDFALLVPQGGDANTSTAVSTGPRSNPASKTGSVADQPNAGLDLVFQIDAPNVPKSGQVPLSYSIVLLRQSDPPQAATKSVEEGRVKGFAGTVQTGPGGETRRREELSVSGLSQGGSPVSYWATLTVTDYTNLPDECKVDCVQIPFEVTPP